MLIALPVSKAEAMKSHWFKVKIAFNLKQDEITLKIHDQEKVCKGVLLSDEFSPKSCSVRATTSLTFRR